jgi:diaminopimelate decarboxylase
VGAYCIEDELILLRRMHFPHGVAPGDLIGLVNTGGYLMHILESASHQIPLARNVVCERGGYEPDPIDHWTSDSGSAVRPSPTVQHPHASSSS